MSDKSLFLITSKAILFNKVNSVLILKRGNAQSFPNTWDFPGGLLDEQDNPSDSILREIKEETGLTPTFIKLIGSTKFTRIDTPTVALIYKGHVSDKVEIQLSFEHSEYIWAPFNDLLKYDLQPWLYEFVKTNYENIPVKQLN